jgi:uncharacterized protein with gpF-like domain
MAGNIESFTRDGKSILDFKDSITEIIGAAGVTTTQPYHLETILRTEGQVAVNYGRQTSQIEAGALAPMWEFSVVDDDRHAPGSVCETVADNGGSYFAPYNDKVWHRHYPPCHYNCRSGVIAHPAATAKELVRSTYALPPSDDGFGSF